MANYKWTKDSREPNKPSTPYPDFDVIAFEEAVNGGMPLGEAAEQYGVDTWRIYPAHSEYLVERSRIARMFSDERNYDMQYNNMYLSYIERELFGERIWDGRRGEFHWKNWYRNTDEQT